MPFRMHSECFWAKDRKTDWLTVVQDSHLHANDSILNRLSDEIWYSNFKSLLLKIVLYQFGSFSIRVIHMFVDLLICAQ